MLRVGAGSNSAEVTSEEKSTALKTNADTVQPQSTADNTGPAAADDDNDDDETNEAAAAAAEVHSVQHKAARVERLGLELAVIQMVTGTKVINKNWFSHS